MRFQPLLGISIKRGSLKKKKKKKTASGFNLISDSRFYFRMTLVLGGSDVHSILENNALKDSEINLNVSGNTKAHYV